MANRKYEEKYTKPALREKLKAEIKASDKGGKAGQWSARKSQLLVQKYEENGGGYKNNKKDEAARSLEEWSEQNWQSRDGKSQARQQDGTQRYLPEEVWNRLSSKEKKEAEETKRKASGQGEQHAAWTPAIKKAMHEAEYAEGQELTRDELYARARQLNISGRSRMNKAELLEAVQKAS